MAEGSQLSAWATKAAIPESAALPAPVEAALPTLARLVFAEPQLVSQDPRRTVEALLAALDRRLTAQLNLIFHHPEFQSLESAWCGLFYLVDHTESDDQLKIRVLNISRKELGRTLKKFKGTAWDQSPIFKLIYEQEYGQFGGEPFGCLLGDYYFDHTPPDVETLGELAQVAAAAHTPFLAGASAALLQMDSWQELSNPRDLTRITQTPEYVAWRALREAEDARYLGLILPRFLARLPYGARTDPVPEFDFEEEVEGPDSQKYLWANSAYAMGVNINRAFKLYGWCTKIRGVESGGMVDGLLCPAFPTDARDVDQKCPTEIAVSSRREAELGHLGLTVLVHRRNTESATFVSAQSVQQPAEYDDPEATANAHLGARLPYLLPTCRFAHYLKCIVRDKIGSFKGRTELQTGLNRWIRNYVEGNPSTASEEAKARRPLAAAEVVVEEVPGSPGTYSAKFFLRPHYQLEGLTVSLRLVSKLSSPVG
ncbi:MAG: type VI secretion system contractile sheath large subunit [Planctomycetota bacterium]|nr:type VI secretion system contractile sheath large subunit [Planctomycetota bacterium]